MCTSLTHRGPDEDGFYNAPGVGLAMRRLSVIDLQTGRQPITNEDQTVWVVFNGEIYNYQELTAQLQAKGHTFATRSDTETIVHLYEEHGLDFVQHLRGMFAIALWDTVRRRLVLVRDRIGEKPLFYSMAGERLLFGSEIKAILQDQRARAVEPEAVCEFLAASYVPAPRTFFRGIHKLPPGALLMYENGRATTRAYWERELGRPSALPFPEAAQALTARLRETIRLCLKSDVEVGAFLSGGIDSSLIVALATATWSQGNLSGGTVSPPASTQKTSRSVAAYTAGNFYRDFTNVWDTTIVCTVYGFIVGSVTLAYGDKFTASQSKDGTHILTVVFRLSWGRVLTN